MSKGRKNRRDKPKPLTPEQIAARERAIEIGSMVVINREEILVRLIDTAIRLWFYNGDYLCVHVLASAAYRTLSDITSKSGLKLWLTEIIGHEQLTSAYDFIRHSSRDLAKVLDFVPDRNIMLLAATVWVFEAVFKYRTPCMSVLMIRFVLWLPAGTMPQTSSLAKLMAEYIPENFNIKEVAQLDEVEFFKKSMPFFEAGGISAQ
jgi:hypothetical protein